MNRSLLLIICDFLLLSMLAMARFDEPEPEPPAQPRPAAVSEEAELIEVLRLSLEAEQASRAELTQDLAATREELDTTAEELQAREQRLQRTAQTLAEREQALEQTRTEAEQLAAERERLAAEQAELTRLAELRAQELEQARRQAQTLGQDLGSLQERAALAQERLRLAQEELEERESALAEAEAERERLAEERAAIRREKQQLSTRLEVTEAEKRLLAENLENAEIAIETERQEKEALRQQADRLTEGVSSLAAASTEMQQELKQSQPKTLNAIWQSYKRNVLVLEIKSTAGGLLGERSDTRSVPAIPVRVNDRWYGLFSTVDTALDPTGTNAGRMRSLSVRIQIGDRIVNLPGLGYLQGDPRVGVVSLSADAVAAADLSGFTLEPQPFRFDEAVLVDPQREFFGDVGFKVNTASDRYLEMDNRIFSGLFGEFSPGNNDIVFAKTGTLLGFMLSDEIAVRIESINTADTLLLGDRFSPETARATWDALDQQIRQLPGDSRP